MTGERFCTVTELVLERAAERGEAPCIRHVRAGAVTTITRRQFQEHVCDLLMGFDALGLVKGEAVGIDSSNRWEWLALDLAAMGRGLVVVPLDAGWSEQRLARILGHAKVRCVCSENADRAQRILKAKSEVPALGSVVLMDSRSGAARGAPPGTTSFEELLQAGREARRARPDALREQLASPGPDDIATLIHTGGSTGEPKGVIRTHRNTASRGWALFPWDGDPANEAYESDELLFDPLSFCHSAGRWWAHMALARGRALALPSAGTEALVLEELALLAPTHIAAVPRIVLQLQRLLMPHVEASWAKLEHAAPEDPAASELRAEFGANLRSMIGGRLRRLGWGGGPLATSLHSFFEVNAGIALACGYGGTEAGIISLQGSARRFGTTGVPLGATVRLDQGEIVVRGPGVTPGYWNNPAATARAQAGDGWWRTGDLGRFDAHGDLVIVGRVSAMFNCSEGTNIDPVEVEQLLEADPYIREAILLGNRRPYLAAILVVDRERIQSEQGISASTEHFIHTRIERINKGLEDYEKIRRFALVDGSFPESVRQVTIANKIRVDREAVERVYQAEISGLYTAPS